MKLDKVIVTNRSALKEKYDERFGRIEQAIQRLIAADQKRGLDTKLVAIDSETDMGAVHGEAVKEKEDQRGVKKAVDALFYTYEPDYIMILGAQDIVPHQDLKTLRTIRVGMTTRSCQATSPMRARRPTAPDRAILSARRALWAEFLTWCAPVIRRT